MRLHEAIPTLQNILHRRDWTDDPQQMEAYCIDHRREYRGKAALLVWPRETVQVSRIVEVCNQSAISIVAQGGNTGLTGASVPRGSGPRGSEPRGSGQEIILNLSRMNRIRKIDKDNAVITVEAGCILADVKDQANRAGFLFPLSLASQGSCQIGGNIATNAGGINVLRYGMTRGLVSGLEVVLADGRILNTLGALIKDNSGYDLKQLFIGSEGTLGIITAASLRLSPIPENRITIMLPIHSAKQAAILLQQMRAAAIPLHAFEYIPRSALELVLSHIDASHDPFPQPAQAYILMEACDHGERHVLIRRVEDILNKTCPRDHHAIIASSLDQERQLWTLRETISEAEQREGGSIKHDISVPPASLPDFLDQAAPMMYGILPDVRIVAFGHFGDGNLHYNLQRPGDMDEKTFLSYRHRFGRTVYDLAIQMGGSISAEHGIGQLRREDLLRYKSVVEIDLMRHLKQALDPNNILNPGKVIDSDAPTSLRKKKG